jgi:hypothetical protein
LGRLTNKYVAHLSIYYRPHENWITARGAALCFIMDTLLMARGPIRGPEDAARVEELEAAVRKTNEVFMAEGGEEMGAFLASPNGFPTNWRGKVSRDVVLDLMRELDTPLGHPWW